jgi:tRNA/tmRNA/rRNA uracil-C5-methylase (TrmA/RlmC/RlmD family)
MPELPDYLEVTVEKPVYRGLGFARHEGQVVLVQRGLPGERVRVAVRARERGFLRAEVAEVLAPSPERRPSPCASFERCGGCAYQSLTYEAQLQAKGTVLRESLARAGVEWDAPIPVAPSPEKSWRTRALVHVEVAGDEVRVGFREAGSHRLVEVDECLQISDRMLDTARCLGAALARLPGLARGVDAISLAESGDGERLVAVLETRLPVEQAPRLAALGAELPWLSGLGAELEGHFVLLGGHPEVDAEIEGARMRAHVRSFFQANRFLVGVLVQAVTEEIPAGASVLDLYSGVGLFARAAVHRAGEVTAVEGNPQAAADARANLQGVRGAPVRIDAGDALRGVRRWTPGGRPVVVLDPPRTGLGRGVVDAVAAKRPDRVVYVSCDPPTLGRDLRGFAARGYGLRRLRALDMFPDTFHVESVAVLEPGVAVTV